MQVSVNDPHGRLQQMLNDAPSMLDANPDLQRELSTITDRVEKYHFLAPYFFHPSPGVRRTATELSVSIDCGGVDYFLSVALADGESAVANSAAAALWQRRGGPKYAATFMGNEIVSPAARIGARSAKNALQLLLDRAPDRHLRDELKEHLRDNFGEIL